MSLPGAYDLDRLVPDWDDATRRDFRARPVTFRHRLRETGLFEDAPLAALLDRYPAELYDINLFDFDDEGRMRARSLHPGVDADQVASNTAFEPGGLAEAPVTEPPTERELAVLRRVVDPRGVLVPSA